MYQLTRWISKPLSLPHRQVRNGSLLATCILTLALKMLPGIGLDLAQQSYFRTQLALKTRHFEQQADRFERTIHRAHETIDNGTAELSLCQGQLLQAELRASESDATRAKIHEEKTAVERKAKSLEDRLFAEEVKRQDAEDRADAAEQARVLEANLVQAFESENLRCKQQIQQGGHQVAAQEQRLHHFHAVLRQLEAELNARAAQTGQLEARLSEWEHKGGLQEQTIQQLRLQLQPQGGGRRSALDIRSLLRHTPSASPQPGSGSAEQLCTGDEDGLDAQPAEGSECCGRQDNQGPETFVVGDEEEGPTCYTASG